MKTLHRILSVLALAWVGATAAPAAELSLEGPRLIVSGLLDDSAARAFAEHLNTGKVRTVVFEDAFGGTVEAAEMYARAIRAGGINTEARGQCYAACAFAFLAGREHRFGRGLQANALLIPAAVRPRPGEARKTLEALTAAGRAALAATSRGAWPPDQGVLFSSTPTLFGRVYKTAYCDGTQGLDTTRCETLPDADPYQLGVLTP